MPPTKKGTELGGGVEDDEVSCGLGGETEGRVSFCRLSLGGAVGHQLL